MGLLFIRSVHQIVLLHKLGDNVSHFGRMKDCSFSVGEPKGGLSLKLSCSEISPVRVKKVSSVLWNRLSSPAQRLGLQTCWKTGAIVRVFGEHMPPFPFTPSWNDCCKLPYLTRLSTACLLRSARLSTVWRVTCYGCKVNRAAAVSDDASDDDDDAWDTNFYKSLEENIKCPWGWGNEEVN